MTYLNIWNQIFANTETIQTLWYIVLPSLAEIWANSVHFVFKEAKDTNTGLG